jgi:hypothetical protein
MVAMSFRRASILLGLCLAPGTLSGCVFSQPQSLVATNIRPTSDPLTAGRLVEAEVCGNRLLGISFGPEPRMTTVMDALQAEAPGAIGFEDIRIDTSWINYLFPLFWQECVRASAYPLLAVTRPHAKPAPRSAPPAPPAEAPEPAAPASDADSAKAADPFAP